MSFIAFFNRFSSLVMQIGSDKCLMTDDRLLTVPAVANYLQVNEHTVTQWLPMRAP